MPYFRINYFLCIIISSSLDLGEKSCYAPVIFIFPKVQALHGKNNIHSFNNTFIEGITCLNKPCSYADAIRDHLVFI
jgi:hypothetical protein